MPRETAVISVKLPRALLDAVDRKIEQEGFQSRSELIRYLLRRWVEGEI